MYSSRLWESLSLILYPRPLAPSLASRNLSAFNSIVP